jgi:DNA-binding NarL/FixJ family response regulator
MIRILIVGGIRLYREGLAQLLGRRGGLTVIGAEPNLRDPAADIQRLEPDVVLLDMATAESYALVRDLKRLAPAVPVVALGVSEREGDILACMEAGVAGYVTREGCVEDLVAAMESAARGELRCAPDIAGLLVRRLAALAADREASRWQAHLTAREREIVRLLEQDLSNKEIAVRLGIEVATVKNHVHHLLEKLNVRRRTEAARLVKHSLEWAIETPGQPSKR